MSQIIHGPPKIWGPGQLPDLPPLKPALAIGRHSSTLLIYHNSRLHNASSIW